MEWDGSNWDSSIILSDPREPLVLTGDNDEGLALELLFFPSEGQHSDHRREHYLEGRFLRSAKINFNVPFIWMAGLHQCPNRKQVQQRSTRPVKERTVSSDSASRCFQNEHDFLNSQKSEIPFISPAKWEISAAYIKRIQRFLRSLHPVSSRSLTLIASQQPSHLRQRVG